MKAVLKGNIIAYEAAERKQEKGKLKEIEDMLVRLEQEYRVAQIAETLKKMEN